MTSPTQPRKKMDENTIYKNLLKDVCSTKIKELSEYFEEITRKFEDDLDEISSEYDKAKKNINDEDEHAYLIHDFYAEDFFKVKDIFIKNFYYSILVTLHSIFESSLNELCQHLQYLYGYKVELGDFAGKGVSRAINYLAKVCLVKYDTVSNELNEIQKLNSIRNCIIHAEGDVTKAQSPKKIKNIIKNTRGVSLSSDTIIIERDYLERLTNYCNIFMSEIIDQGFAKKIEEKL